MGKVLQEIHHTYTPKMTTMTKGKNEETTYQDVGNELHKRFQ